jgi:murein DD-endopeptidase MepM/ murein hydrolase activator NlpD
MIRPVDAEISQRFGDNPTAAIRPGSPDYWIIQQFGNYQPDGHTGEDYACPIGTPVQAVADGTVLHVGWMAGTYADNPWWVAPGFAGYCAVIDHGSFIGIYGHCSDGSAKVSKGQRVAEGQVFILSGNTGGSTGPHLHFEILPDGYVLNSRFYGRIDPEPLFTGSLSYDSESITPITAPKEWYEMALDDDTKRQINEAVWGGPGMPLIFNNELQHGEYAGTMLGAMTDRIVRQQIVPLRQEVAAQNAQIVSLISALANVSKGEPFDEAKLLAGVQSAAESGVKNAIESITVTVK